MVTAMSALIEFFILLLLNCYYILLNLLFSTQAAYAAPIIMMAQNRQNERDRAQADEDFRTNVEAKKEIEELQVRLNAIEIDKLDKIITMLEKMDKK